MDEPFVSLDQPTAENLYEVLNKLLETNKNYNYFNHSRTKGSNSPR